MQAILALLIVVLLPLLDRGAVAALRRSLPGSGRMAVYRRSALTLWLATAAAFAVTVGPGWRLFLIRSPAAEAWAADHRLWINAAMLAIGAFFLIAIAQGLACVGNATRRKRIAPAFARLRFLLPASRLERRWWILLSVSAGIGEEVLYRGFLLHFMLEESTSGLQPGLLTAVVLSALAFGLAHLYQGWRGMLASTAMGLVFAVLAIGTGSLFLPMALHVVIDLQILWMYRPDLDGEPENHSRNDAKNFFA